MRGGTYLSNINIGTKMRTLDVGQKQAAYTGVIVHAGQTEDGQAIDYSVGNDTGSVLEVTVPNGTLTLAYMLLDKLKLRGYRYQPFEADGAIADPSIEIGDNITANNVPSIVMGINTNHSRLMASTLKAPFDEEVNHEWQYEPRSERQFKRESAYTRSRLTINENEISAEVVRATDAENVLSGRISVTATDITAEVARATREEGRLRSSIQINADNITAEVTRATNAEGSLSSRITQNATDITAKVSKSGGNSSSFAWTLTDSSWTLTSNGATVLKATSSGIEITGKITATSGVIGGFEIDYNSLGKATPDTTTAGDTQHQVLLFAPDSVDGGTGAIRVRHREYDGNSYGSWVNDFLVQYNGKVTASNLDITGGSIKLGGTSYSPVFQVTSAGAVTASNLSITGGSISIGSNFYVDSDGNLTANSGSFRGNVSAGNIQYGGDYGTFSGGGLSDYSISWSKYGTGSVYGGVDDYGNPTGSLAAYTVAYGNSGFTSTLDQVGTNASNITSLSNSLADKRSISNCNFDNLYLLKEGYYHSLYADYLTIDGNTYKVVFWN